MPTKIFHVAVASGILPLANIYIYRERERERAREREREREKAYHGNYRTTNYTYANLCFKGSELLSISVCRVSKQ